MMDCVFPEARGLFVHDHEDQVEDLQGADDTGDDDEEDGGRKKRQRNAEELLDACGAVNTGSLVVILGISIGRRGTARRCSLRQTIRR